MELQIRLLGWLAILLAAGSTATPAQAQDYVECRSQNFQYKACPVPWARSELVRRFSDSECIENRTWGQGAGFVWVHQGCGANFGAARYTGGGVQPGSGQMECNSDRNRYKECRTNWRSAQLVRQTSDATCAEGQTWGFRNGVLWVDRGCAGVFADRRGGPGWGGGGGAGEQVECNSVEHGYRECRTGNWRSAQLVRQSSSAQCVEGRTWGYGRGVLWVDRGCAGTFAAAGGGWGGGGGGQGSGRSLTCNSDQNRYRECPAGGWRGAQLLRQTSRASCIEGQTWGLRHGTIWVDRGCAGQFGETRR